MKQISTFLQKLLHVLLAFSLAFMCVLVFGNVVLRYVFNSGITWSEEFSRFLFVWMIFLGAIGALKDNEHLGVDMLIKRVPGPWKKILYVLSNLMVLYALWLIFDGSRKMTVLNVESYAPATGMSYAYLHAVGMIMSAAMALIVIFNLCRALFQAGSIDLLVPKKETEEDILHTPTAAPLIEQPDATGGHR